MVAARRGEVQTLPALQKQNSFPGFSQKARGDPAARPRTDNDDVIICYAVTSNPIIFQAMPSLLPPLPGSE